MAVATDDANDSSSAGRSENVDLSFLPQTLTRQCSSLIKSYHEVHGYACLPDLLWKSRLGPFIERQAEFRQILRKASTTRSAKKSNEGFVRIATSILSLEILASRFSGWSTIHPEAAAKAEAVLRRNAHSPHMPLMDFYLYPPKHLSSAAIATLTLPPNPRSGEAGFYRTSEPELSGEKLALNYVNTVQQPSDGRLGRAATSSSS